MRKHAGKLYIIAIIIVAATVGGTAYSAMLQQHGWTEVSGTGYCIFSFTQSNCPSGWSKPNSAYMDKFIMVAGVGEQVGAIIQGNTSHNHSISGGTNTPSAGQTADYDNTDADKDIASAGHTHSFSTVSDYAEPKPEFVRAVLCCKD
jgi:hypothetical protein